MHSPPVEEARRQSESERAVPRTLGSRRSQARISPFSAVALGTAALLTALIGYPMLKVLMGLLWQDGQLTFAGLDAIRDVPDLGDTLMDTAIVLVVSGCLAIFIGSAFAWLNERTDARMGAVTDILPIVNFLLPTVASAIGWLLLLSSQSGYINLATRAAAGRFGIHMEDGPFDANTWYAVILVYTLSIVPFVFLVVSSGLRNLDPYLEEQSRVCGAGPIKTIVLVTMPALRPSLWTATFLAAWFGLAAYSIPTVLAEPGGINMLSVKVVDLLRFTYPPKTLAAIGLSVIMMVVLLTVWLLQQRALHGKNIAVLGGKGARASRIQLGRARVVARAVILAYLVLAVVLPIAALLLVSLSGYWSSNIDWGNLGFDAFRDLFANEGRLTAIRNSLLLATVTATVAVAAAVLVTWYAQHNRGPATTFAGMATKLPAMIPGVVIAVGFVLAYGGPPFFIGGTLMILLLAYLIGGMPEATVTSEAAIGQVGNELSEASHVAGASQVRTFFNVYLPLMLPGLAAGWALVFVRVVGDLEMSVMLATTGNPVIGYEIYGIFNGGGGFDSLAALAVLITAISVLVLGVVLGLSARRPWRKV